MFDVNCDGTRRKNDSNPFNERLIKRFIPPFPPVVYLLLIAVSACVPAQSSMDRGKFSLPSPSPSPSLSTSKLKHGAPVSTEQVETTVSSAQVEL